jgi:hypothetical protein
MPKIDAIKERARTVGEKITSQTFPIQERLEQLNKAKKEPAPPQDRYGGYTDSSRTSLQVNVAGGEEAKSLPPVEVTATQDQEQVLLPNPLHQYSSSTYSISTIVLSAVKNMCHKMSLLPVLDAGATILNERRTFKKIFISTICE